jgi:hypothetical protein
MDLDTESQNWYCPDVAQTPVRCEFVDVEVDWDTRDATGVFEFGPELEWKLEARLRMFEHGMSLVGLCVEPTDATPPGGLTTRALRQLPLAKLERVTRTAAQQFLTALEGGGPGFQASPKLKRALRKRAKEFDARPRPGRRGRDDREYAAIAAMYVDALAKGQGSEALAERLQFSVSRVRNLVYEARRRGLLTETKKGKAGGGLTKHARGLLEED